jgi:hypothetical protein
MCKPGTPSQEFIKQQALDKMTTILKHRPDIIETIVPKDFDIGCRRLTPGPGFLVPKWSYWRSGTAHLTACTIFQEALGSDNVELISDGIAEITEDSIIDVDGVERKVDAIVCATG